jgi:hypothetical protein
MKKVKPSDDMRPEYKLSDFKVPGVRGQYYERIKREGTNVVLLDRDVAKAFPNSASVNKALRSILKGKSARRSSAGRARRKRAVA